VATLLRHYQKINFPLESFYPRNKELNYAGLYKFIRRKLLGFKGMLLLSSISSGFLTNLGIVDSRRENKEKGISALVVSYNDPYWIEISLRSISDLVDEIVVVDSSNDETVEILERLSRELPIKLIRQPLLGIKKAKETALANISFKYVLAWDTDFIATQKLKERVRSFVEKSNERYYYLAYFPFIALCGDLSHRCNIRYHIEHWLYTWSKKLKYLWDGSMEYLYAPAYYKRVILDTEPLGYHLTGIRKPERMALKVLYRISKYFDIMEEKGKEEAELALKSVALERFGTQDLKEIGHIIIRDMIKGKPCFDYRKLPEEVLERAKELGVPLGRCDSNYI